MSSTACAWRTTPSLLERETYMDTVQQELDLGVSKVPVMNSELGDKLRDSGMRAALSHAEHHYEGWSEAAYVFLLASPFNEFRNEQIREFAYQKGLPNPPSERSWGGVIRRAAAAGIIQKSGMTVAKAKNVHSHPITLWRKTGQSQLISNLLNDMIKKIS